ncbi:probable G-protein coupled receptor 139 [Rhincodon typus]|uniref:probable G-protein coupled receptor 139 n=1 Tax=Rhincodon typus TaxID=259920 RepID=UPI00202F04A0|nr:probable G-protein coupled receptor 139 [Rhincodon typus]
MPGVYISKVYAQHDAAAHKSGHQEEGNIGADLVSASNARSEKFTQNFEKHYLRSQVISFYSRSTHYSISIILWIVHLFHIAANLAVIVILSRGRCGLSKCITYYLVSMAATDLLAIITAVILNRIVGMYFPFSFMFVTPVCSVNFVLMAGSRDCSIWATVVFTVDRFVAISCPKLKRKYCTGKAAAVIIGAFSGMSCFKNTFWYFIYEPLCTIGNIPWHCKIKSIFYTSPAWAAYDWIHCISTPCLPFVLILLLNAVTVRQILKAIRIRKRLRVGKQVENLNDTEVNNRRKSIILLFCISGSFILLWLLFLLTFLYVRIKNVSYFSGSNYNESNFNLEESGYMLQILSSCINPFIYTGTQGKFRHELRSGIQFSVNFISKIFKF